MSTSTPTRSGTAAGEAAERSAEAPGALSNYTSAYGYSAAGTALASRRRGSRTLPRRVLIIGGALLPLVLLASWQLISTSGLIPAYRLPSPAAVWLAGVELATSEQGLLGQYVAISTQRVVLGFLIGSLIGLVLGAIVGLSKWASVLFAPTIGAFRAVPSLAWVPLLVLYMGINEDSKVTLIAIGALFPVYTTVAGSLRHVDPHLVEVGRAFGMNRISLLGRVQLPAVIPSVVSGLRLALAQSWLFLVAAELIASSTGLGFLLLDSQNNGRLDRIFLAIVLLAILGKTTDALIGLLERFLLRRWT